MGIRARSISGARDGRQAARRATLLALLLPDPCDEDCPEEFKDTVRICDQRRRGASASPEVPTSRT